MTDGPISPRSPRSVFRKNTPAETRANWALVKASGGRFARLAFLALIAGLLALFSFATYSRGYFDGMTCARASSQKDSDNDC